MKDTVLKTVSRKLQSFAIDFVNIPFYGEEENKRDTIKTKARNQPILCMRPHIPDKKEQTLHISVKYIRPGNTLKSTIDFLIKEVEDIGFRIKGLYLDREFYTIEVINYLQGRKIPL